MAANQIVVRSTGPSARAYPVGRQLEAGSQLRLDLGDSLIVLGPSRAKVLQGPGTFVLAAEESAHPFNRSRFSARRGLALPRGPWTLAPGENGRLCATTEGLSLWRATADVETNVAITSSDGRSKTIKWPAERYMLKWPSDFALADGATYRIGMAGEEASPVTIAVINANPADPPALARALLDRGCSAQLDRFVEQMLAN